ncbi:hypothetical protein GGX14DRAFT_699569 [Mycena pura]|uniref:BTB domain-containing protein n=1 Tax=Mycena pura TaxID=153505 RepID=A0AAD6V6L3_9AGAR|nr:hypothetical protein GGX14DRAFT_699569 [Mycena pura]
MFQVAPQPAAFQPAPHHRKPSSSLRPRTHDHHHRERERAHDHAAPLAPPAIKLPRTLARPPFADIARDALAAAAPDLAAVPADFIRHGLRATAPAMLAGIAALAPSHVPQALPRSRLPSALSVPLRAHAPGTPHPPLPTHIVAVSAAAKSSKDEMDGPTRLFPMHAVVLAAHCTKLTRLPPSSSSSRASVSLPVIQLPLPSPPAFAILHSWMYTGRLDAALSALLPVPSSFLERLAAAQSSTPSTPGSAPDPAHAFLASTLSSRTAQHALAAHLCAAASGNLTTLMEHAGHVKELWQDMVALGVCDPGLWAALDVAWETVLGAMNLAAHPAQ